MLMGKRRPATTDPDAIPSPKRPKKAPSTNQSKYTPSNPAEFLANRHALGNPNPQGLSPSVGSMSSGPMTFSGYSESGLPATYNAPTRSNSGLSLEPYSTPKALLPQRSIGTLGQSPFSTAQTAGTSASFYGNGGQNNPSSAAKLATSAAPTRQSNATGPISVPRALPFSASAPKEQKSSSKTSFNNNAASVVRGGRGGAVNTIGCPRAIPLSEVSLSNQLSPGQRAIVEKALKGDSFFFTGAAGTGKSFVLKEIIRLMQSQYDVNELQVVAPTGMAAIELGGWTIHSFAGIGLGQGTPDELYTKVNSFPKSRARWRQAAVLIIDEVSMLSAALFDKLEYIATKIRRKPAFGGLQLIMCGDFFQLPPVSKASETKEGFAFQASKWKECVPETFTLTQIFRQVGESSFINMLNEIRLGNVSAETYQALLARVGVRRPKPGLPSSSGPSSSLLHPTRPSEYSPAVISIENNRGAWQTKEISLTVIEPTRLFPTKNDVLNYNLHRLKQLSGTDVVFEAIDRGAAPVLKTIQDHCPAAARIQLKIGAQVVLLRNKADYGLVNGSRGTIKDFLQRPGPTPADPIEIIPQVQFESGVIVEIDKETWSIDQGAEVLAERKQIPLALAWALSIHKSQGMTITEVEVSLKNIFEDGQAYVALSRVTSLAGLCISEPFGRDVFRTNQEVVKFYQTLSQM